MSLPIIISAINLSTQFAMAKAAHNMIVYHADSLHKRVHDGWPDKVKPSSLEVLTEGAGFRRLSRYLPEATPVVYYGAAADKIPDVGIEASKLFLDCQELARVLDCGIDF